jgi:hypothetical protein
VLLRNKAGQQWIPLGGSELSLSRHLIIAPSRTLTGHGFFLRLPFGGDQRVNAIDMGDAPMVQSLLNSGADIQEKDLRGLTPLSRAVLSNYKDVVAVLLKAGADVNARDGLGLTPLHYAAMADYGETGIVQQLLAAGSKLDIKDPDGHTAYEMAERFHYELLASALRGE